MRYLALAVAVGFAAPVFASTGDASQKKAQDQQNQGVAAQQSEPVAMTDQQLDGVVAGALINIGLNNTQVGVLADVNVAANVLTSQSSAIASGGTPSLDQGQGSGVQFQH